MAAERRGSESRKDQILQAALGLVATQGLQGLNMAALARRVGLVPSALYRHFKGRDEILDAVIELWNQKLQEIVRAARAETRDPVRCLRALLKRHTELIRDHPAIPRIIFSDEVYSGRAERKDKMYQVLRRYLQEVGDIIRQGQKEKRIPGAGPPETLALMFVGLVVPGGILWHASDGKFDITRQVDRAWKVFQTQVLMK